MTRKTIWLSALIALGSLTSILGLLFPLATLPTGETVSFLSLNQGFALAVIALALIAAGLGFSRHAKFALVPALLVAGLASFGVSAALTRIDAAKFEIQNLIESSPFGALAGNLLSEFQVHGYWLLIFIGVAVSTLGSLLAFSKNNLGKKELTRQS